MACAPRLATTDTDAAATAQPGRCSRNKALPTACNKACQDTNSTEKVSDTDASTSGPQGQVVQGPQGQVANSVSASPAVVAETQAETELAPFSSTHMPGVRVGGGHARDRSTRSKN